MNGRVKRQLARAALTAAAVGCLIVAATPVKNGLSAMATWVGFALIGLLVADLTRAPLATVHQIDVQRSERNVARSARRTVKTSAHPAASTSRPIA